MRIHEINTVNGRYELQIDEVHSVRRIKKTGLLGVTESKRRVEVVTLRIVRHHNVLGIRKVTAARVNVARVKKWDMLSSQETMVFPLDDLKTLMEWYVSRAVKIAKWLESAPFYRDDAMKGGGGNPHSEPVSP